MFRPTRDALPQLERGARRMAKMLPASKFAPSDRQRIIRFITVDPPEHLARDPEPAGASSVIRKEGG